MQEVRTRGGYAGVLLAALLVIAATAHAVEETGGGVETKLRDALRTTMLKLRDAQGQVAAAQAAQIAAEEKIQELTKKHEVLGKDLIAERKTAANTIAELNAKLEERSTVIIGLQAMLQKWKTSYSELTAFASKKEFERAELQAKAFRLERLVAHEQVKNLEMYQAGMATLDRYEKFGLGDAILAREPFVGTTKVKFQNLIQSLGDKLTDARIIPGQEPPAPETKAQKSEG